MNLLEEGIKVGAVVETGLTRRIIIDGLTNVYKVYKIRLDLLYYNEKNDRIATWISKYKSEHNGKLPDSTNREKYNEIIEDFIVKSHPSSIETTKNNIKAIDQQQPGVVLNDGRVIDGNRRFTCLRKLAKENDKFKYFEAIILERNYENNAKEIKKLELSIQHGEESKVEYNVIDKLVGIYNDIIDSKLLSVEEYAKSINDTEVNLKKDIEVAELMVEFLDYINAPKEFHLARTLGVGATLIELPSLLKKCRTEDEKEDFKISIFTNLIMKPNGSELRNFVRGIKKIAGSDFVEDFLEEQKEIAIQIINKLPPVGKVSEKSIRETIGDNEKLNLELTKSAQKFIEKVNVKDIKNKPAELIEKAATSIENIDINILAKLNDTEIGKLEMKLNKLETLIENIRSKIDA